MWAEVAGRTQNAYLFEQVALQPNKDNTKILQTNQTNFPETSIKLSILFLGLTMQLGFLEGKQEVLPIGLHDIATHFCRKPAGLTHWLQGFHFLCSLSRLRHSFLPQRSTLHVSYVLEDLISILIYTKSGYHYIELPRNPLQDLQSYWGRQSISVVATCPISYSDSGRVFIMVHLTGKFLKRNPLI